MPYLDRDGLRIWYEDHAGHVANLDRPEAFNTAVAELLDSIAP